MEKMSIFLKFLAEHSCLFVLIHKDGSMISVGFRYDGTKFEHAIEESPYANSMRIFAKTTVNSFGYENENWMIRIEKSKGDSKKLYYAIFKVSPVREWNHKFLEKMLKDGYVE